MLLPRLKPVMECFGKLVAVQGHTILTLVSSDARRSSCSSSKKRYSRSHKRDRCSHSSCCPTATHNGVRVFRLPPTQRQRQRYCFSVRKRSLSAQKIAALRADSYLFFADIQTGRGSSLLSSALPLSLFRSVAFRLVNNYEFSAEGQTRAVARVRARRSVMRARTSETAVRTREAARPQHTTASAAIEP